MAELTTLDEKLGEVLGLAQAAQQATEKVRKLAEDEGEDELVALMQRMNDEAAETERRCQELADSMDGKKTALNEKARETKQEIADFMKTYLQDAEALDGLEFLSMSEAGELAHWEIVGQLNEKARDPKLAEILELTLPIQRGHVDGVREHSLRMAAEEDPSEPA